MPKQVVTFDFDNTIAMSYMDLESENVDYVFQGYNEPVINIIRQHIANGDEVFIVTSRKEDKEGMYPNDTVPVHLKKLGLDSYFLPNRLFYTNGAPKIETLRKLGSKEHWDDDVEELIALKNSEIAFKDPLKFEKDADIVAKCLIFDVDDRILLLKRSDAGEKWDIPGGHVKELEVQRGKWGLHDGLEREVGEETGIILPNERQFYNFDHTHKGRTNKIYTFLSKLNEKTPSVNLNLQDFQENIDFAWVEVAGLEHFMQNMTFVARNAIEKFLSEEQMINEEGRYLASQRKKWRKEKKRLVGMGKNRNFGGGKGWTRPKMSKGKAAPPAFAVLEEEGSGETKKIKVKIKHSVVEKKKKKKKSSYYPHYELYDDPIGGDGE
jgi:ADP-ribose pyrophosphatase YjhB (NUDIX family)